MAWPLLGPHQRPHSPFVSVGIDIFGSSTIGQPSFYKSLNLAPQGEPGYAKTAEYIGAFNGVNAAGSAIGAAICSYCADKFVSMIRVSVFVGTCTDLGMLSQGRKRTIQVAALVLIIGAAICAGSVNVGMFM
jgi:MFS family permease